MENQGLYSCVAENSINITQSYFYLNILGQLTPPIFFFVVNKTNSRFNLKCLGNKIQKLVKIMTIKSGGLNISLVLFHYGNYIGWHPNLLVQQF